MSSLASSRRREPVVCDEVAARSRSTSASVKRQTGSHKTLQRVGSPDYVFVFHDGVEIGPRMLARIAKHTGLKPEDL
jgi:hypothetical protein